MSCDSVLLLVAVLNCCCCLCCWWFWSVLYFVGFCAPFCDCALVYVESAYINLFYSLTTVQMRDLKSNKRAPNKEANVCVEVSSKACETRVFRYSDDLISIQIKTINAYKIQTKKDTKTRLNNTVEFPCVFVCCECRNQVVDEHQTEPPLVLLLLLLIAV